jgi:hypothetical protein
MSLPNPGMDAVPFTPLTAEFLDDMIANVEALAAGTGLNDASVSAVKLVTGATAHNFVEIGRTTLAVAGDTITVTVPAFRHLKIVARSTPTGGTNHHTLRFNGDTGNNYDIRLSVNGGADASATSQSGLDVGYSVGTFDMLTIVDVTNISTLVKNVMGTAVANTTTVGTAPGKKEVTGKWANTSSQITSVTIFNDGTGDMAIGSEVIVYGHN